jgi:putative peptidoglycan lipid II flippase
VSALYWSVFRAATTIAVLSALVRLVSLARETLIAYRVGTAPELDAFLLAYAFPSFLLNVFTGAVAAAFVPAYVRLRATEGEERAKRFATSVTWLLAGALVVCVLVLAPISGTLIRLIAAGFDDKTTDAAVAMLYALMPVLFFSGLTGYWSGFLHAHQRFGAAALIPLATPCAIIVGLLVFWNAVGINALVTGTLVGGMMEAVSVAWVARRNGLRLLPFVYPDWRRIKSVLADALPTAGSSLLIGATLLVDQAMAAMLVPGSLAAFSYGTRVPGVLLAIGTTALGTAILPHLSSLIVQTRFTDMQSLLRQYVALTVGVTIPFTAVLVGASESLVSVLFERGSFGSSESELVANVQSAYALQIPFFALATIAVRLISAMQANKLLLISSAISLLLDIVLNWLLSRYFGVAGIALSTSIVCAVACFFLWSVAIRKLKRLGGEAHNNRAVDSVLRTPHDT